MAQFEEAGGNTPNSFHKYPFPGAIEAQVVASKPLPPQPTSKVVSGRNILLAVILAAAFLFLSFQNLSQGLIIRKQHDYCKEVAATTMVNGYKLPDNWTVKCIPSIDARLRNPNPDVTVSGLVNDEERVMYLKQSSPILKEVFVHELGHVWATEHLSYEERRSFSSEVGSSGWYGEDYEMMGSEIWARGFAACQGFKDPANNYIPPCAIMEKYLSKATS